MALELATFIGISIVDFWDITPFELNIAAKSYEKRNKADREEKITLAYVNALWTIQWLGKKHQQPKPLKEILDSTGKEKKAMTDDEMLEKAKILNRLFGGEAIEKSE